MRNFLKKTLLKILKFFAKSILKKYKPDVIGVTGSFGKTSTKEAIYAVLSGKFSVRRNIKNYNNEIGLPLSIIGAESGGGSFWDWLGVFMKAILLLSFRDKDYPEMLVLEMAVDHPGDMKYLTDLAPCRVGVVTSVGPVHLEFFKTVERIAKEKSVLVTHIGKNGWAIINNDNEHTAQMVEKVKCRSLTYGINKSSDVVAKEIRVSSEDHVVDPAMQGVGGLNFKLTYNGSSVPVFLPHVLGEHLIYAALAGAAVGVAYEMNLVDISRGLGKFEAPRGRMRVLSGIKDTLIIDDTYNAGPDSTKAALGALKSIESSGKKFAVLGDMLELGTYTEEGHKMIGREVVNNQIDYLVTVGERAKDIAAQAKKMKMSQENIFSFEGTDRAGRFVQDRLETGDLVLIKGSQGMRMEKVVKEIMAEPLRAADLLVRQEDSWKKK